MPRHTTLSPATEKAATQDSVNANRLAIQEAGEGGGRWRAGRQPQGPAMPMDWQPVDGGGRVFGGRCETGLGAEGRRLPARVLRKWGGGEMTALRP
jgi:hypothetical protein